MAENKNFKTNENLPADIINKDKSNIHKTAINTSLDSSVKDDFIKNRTYEIQQKYHVDNNNNKKQEEYKKQNYKQQDYKQQDYKQQNYRQQEYRQQEYNNYNKENNYTNYDKKQTYKVFNTNIQNDRVSTNKVDTLSNNNIRNNEQKDYKKQSYKTYKQNQEQNYNDYSNQLFKTNEHSTADLINKEQSDIHRTAVRSSLDSSIKDDFIKNKTYNLNKNYNINHMGSHNISAIPTKIVPYGEKVNLLNQENTDPINYEKSNISNSQLRVERYKKNAPKQRGIKNIDVEANTRKTPLYGTIENKNVLNTTLTGVAGGAVLHGVSQNIINNNTAGIGSEFINDSVKDTIKDKINRSSSDILSDKVSKKTGKGRISREIESSIEQLANAGGDLTDRSQVVASKYGYKTGKHTVKGAKSIIKGGSSFARYSKDLRKEVKEGLITGKEAGQNLLNQGKKSIKGSSSSIGKILVGEALLAVDDLEGSDDLGMQAIIKPKNLIRDTKRSLRTAKKAKDTTKKGFKGVVGTTKKIGQKTVHGAKYVYSSVKTAVTNPVVIKSALISIIIIIMTSLVLAVVSSITAIVPTISLKSEDVELTKTYEHMTKLDAELSLEIRGVQTSWSNRNIDEFHYYVNGYETIAESIEIITNIDSLILFLDTKYDDYAFNKIIHGLLGGTNVKEEITNIHEILYSYETHKWIEEIEHSSSSTDEDGNTVNDSWTETIRHMDINVVMKSFDEYLYENMDSLLTSEEQERMSALQEVGLYTSKISLSSPFEDDYYLSSRWGWRIHPIDGNLSMHSGIDIPKPMGTKILNTMNGYVDTIGNDSDGYGKYVIVKSNDDKRKVLYAHMSSINVSQGNQLRKGDYIGNVGNTGASTGSHLHFEYYIKGDYQTNPQFFLEGAYNGGFAGGGAVSDSIVGAALSQVGNVGGQPYWSWYGFNSRVEWCATFVSWAANQAGYLQDGTIPKFAGCQLGGVNWFKAKGQWQNRGYIPKAGDIIFFDWGNDGWSDHVGIVVSSDGNIVHTVEGNTSNSVARRTYHINSSSIMGYGIPNYTH